jgi:hypothetical protein
LRGTTMNSPSSSHTCRVAKFHTEAALHHKKHLVLVLVMMPDKLAFEFIELDQLTIEFTSDVRLPVLRNLSKLLSNIYFVHDVSSTKIYFA